MWLQDKWQQWQERRAQKFLSQHRHLALNVLRRDQELASSVMQTILAQSDGPERDTFAYPSLASYGFGGSSPLQRTLPKPTPVAIRTFSEHPTARRALNVFENGISEMPFTIGVRRPVGTQAHDVEPPPTEEQAQRIRAVTEMFLRPNNEQNWHEFLEQILEDLLCMGAGPFEVEDNASDDRPLFLWPVDVQSVRINTLWHPGLETYRYSQGRGYMFGSIGTTDDVRLLDTQLCYPKLNSRTSTPFGFGYLETAYEAINAFIGAFSYAERRASNATPNFGLFLGENLSPDQVRRWQHYWENEIEGYGKVPILGGGRQPTAFSMAGTGQDQLYLQWQQWIVRIIAMAFGISPMKMELSQDVNRSTATQQSSDDWATVAPVANIVRDTCTHWVLWKRLGYTDLEFTWQVRTTDELRQAQILAEQWDMNGITVDEIRQVYERSPLPDGLGNLTKTAYENAIRAAAQMPAQQLQYDQAIDRQALQNDAQRQADMITPLDADMATLSPQESAFIRELMKQKRRDRVTLAAVSE